MISKFYVPIDSISLPSIYGAACIKPKQYHSTSKIDLQNRFPSYLLITTKMGSDESDCAIELALSEDEIKSLQPISKDNDILLFSKPLPLSRIKSVYFNNEEVKEKIIAIINASTAFLDNKIASVVVAMQKVDLESINVGEITENIDLLPQLTKYDSLVGGFALMRLAGEVYMNYSENYFSTLSFFNSQIKSELIKAGISINDKFHDAFLGVDKFKTLYPFLTKEITEIDVINSAKLESQQVEKNKLTGIIDIDLFDRMTYVLGVLYTYGVGEEARRKKVDTLIANNFKGDIKTDKAEIIALCFGLNRGYSTFTKKYRVGNSENNVKFQMNKKLDYYTIESLYQYAFYNINSSTNFKYLDDWCPVSYLPLKKGTYKIIDEIVTVKKNPKVGSKEYLLQVYHSVFQKNFENLFAPFIDFVVKKVTFDYELENEEMLESKNIEIKELNLKLKDKDILLQKIELLESQLEKKNMQDYTLVEEPNVKYLPTPDNENGKTELEELKDLFKKISKETTAKNIHSLIKDYKENTLFNTRVNSNRR